MLPDGFIFVAEPLAAPGVVPDVLPAPFIVPLPEPVVPPLAPDAAGFPDVPPPTAPGPACASANVLVNESAPASAMVESFMIISSWV